MYRTIEFPLPAGAEPRAPLEEAVLVCRLEGAAAELTAPVIPHAREGTEALERDLLRRPPDAADQEFLETDPAAMTITLRPGAWAVEGDVVLPPGHVVHGGPGVTLDLAPQASLVSFSPLALEGSEEQPIRVRGGAGLVVLAAGRPSRLRHVWFERPSAPRRPGWAITGAVTFYESPAELEECRFLDADAEDALNVIRGEVALRGNVFSGSRSDAVDLDFCDGVVADCTFASCGNDGLDISGGRVRLERVAVRGAGDKGVSCGEGARVDGEGIEVERARIGVASKDLSEVALYDVRVSGCAWAFAAYRKKPEFGPGALRVSGSAVEGTGERYLLEWRSTLVIDGRPCDPNTRDALAVLEGDGDADER